MTAREKLDAKHLADAKHYGIVDTALYLKNMQGGVEYKLADVYDQIEKLKTEVQQAIKKIKKEKQKPENPPIEDTGFHL